MTDSPSLQSSLQCRSIWWECTSLPGDAGSCWQPADISLDCTTLRCTALHCTALRCTGVCTALHCTVTTVHWYNSTIIQEYSGKTVPVYNIPLVHQYTCTLVHCTGTRVAMPACTEVYTTRLASIAPDYIPGSPLASS